MKRYKFYINPIIIEAVNEVDAIQKFISGEHNVFEYNCIEVEK